MCRCCVSLWLCVVVCCCALLFFWFVMVCDGLLFVWLFSVEAPPGVEKSLDAWGRFNHDQPNKPNLAEPLWNQHLSVGIRPTVSGQPMLLQVLDQFPAGTASPLRREGLARVPGAVYKGVARTWRCSSVRVRALIEGLAG